jgi:hypothetical protein
MWRTRWIIFCIGILAVSLPTAAFADSLGNQASFTVDPDFDAKERETLFASLQVVSDQLYFYVEDEWWGILDTKERNKFVREVKQLAASFEGEIYPVITSIFGFENRPGIDKDTRITILVHRLQDDLKGYFSTGNGYSVFESPGSNEREMMYMSPDAILDELASSYLAHEFMHLVYFNQKQIIHNISDEIWIQEGFAELAPTLVGYDDLYEESYLERRVRDFISNPRDSLVEWRGTRADYGAVNLFFQYIVDRYGEGVLAETLRSAQGGIASLEAGFSQKGIDKSFSEVFQDWMIALYINDCSYGDEYCFERMNLQDIRVAPFTNFLSSFGETQLTVTNETKDWAGNWHKISGGKGELKILFDGNPHVQFMVPYLVQNEAGTYEIGSFALAEDQTGEIIVPNFGSKNQSIIILPAVQGERNGLGEKVASHFFSWTVSTGVENEEQIVVEADPVETSPGDVSAEIASLLQQIALLQAQIVVLQEQLRFASGESFVAIACGVENNLFLGSRQKEEIRCLQEFLRSQGAGIYPEGLVTGNFLNLTRQAVIRFQEKYAADILQPLGLEKGTGFVGFSTRNKIKELMQRNTRGLTLFQSGV